MDDTFIHSTKEHMDDLMDLFKVLRKYGLKISPHKCQFFKKKIVSWPENQGILFFYISKTLQMIQISFMASLLNAVL